MRYGTIAIAALLALGACADAGTDMGPLQTRSTALGPVLTDARGMTLYTYTDDPSGESACYGKCATSWPPATANGSHTGAGKLSVVARKDGTKQWAYDGKPLYLWVKDKAPGDTTGHDVGEVWKVAQP